MKTRESKNNRAFKAVHKKIDCVLDNHHHSSKDCTSAVSKGRFFQLSYTAHQLHTDLWELGFTVSLYGVKQHHIALWMMWLSQKKRKPGTIMEYGKRLQIWFNWLGKPELLSDPKMFVNGLELKKPKKPRPKEKLRKSLRNALARFNGRHMREKQNSRYASASPSPYIFVPVYW